MITSKGRGKSEARTEVGNDYRRRASGNGTSANVRIFDGESSPLFEPDPARDRIRVCYGRFGPLYRTYIRSYAVVHVLPLSADCSENWRTESGLM